MFQTLAIFLGLSDRDGRWPRVRRQHLLREPACQWCGTDSGLAVHHVLPYHLYKSLELSEENLITLCGEHHLGIGHLGDFQAFNPSVRTDCQWYQGKVKNRPYKRAKA